MVRATLGWSSARRVSVARTRNHWWRDVLVRDFARQQGCTEGRFVVYWAQLDFGIVVKFRIICSCSAHVGAAGEGEGFKFGALCGQLDPTVVCVEWHDKERPRDGAAGRRHESAEVLWQRELLVDLEQPLARGYDVSRVNKLNTTT